MSKAFTKDENEGPGFDDLPPPNPTLPPGVTNYLTARGAARLREDLRRWVEVERPAALASAREGAEGKRRLAFLDQRIAHLEQSLGNAQVVEHEPGPAGRVTFGATVTVRDHQGATNRYRIVGVDEADAEEGCISWLSPLAKGLINGKPGAQIMVDLPEGETAVEILDVVYE